MSVSEFKLPELGENVFKGLITNLFVTEGQSIQLDQVLLEIETDKAVIQVPSTFDGKILDILVKAGEMITVGQTLLTYQPISTNGSKAIQIDIPENVDSSAVTISQSKTSSTQSTVAADSQRASAMNPSDSKQTIHDIKIPELGENIRKGLVVNVLVKKGDVIAKDQRIMELETDKAVVEIPSPLNGIVQEIMVQVGEAAYVQQTVLKLLSTDFHNTPISPPAQSIVSAQQPMSPLIRKDEPAPISYPSDTKNAIDLPVTDALIPAAPSVRRFAREIGIDLRQVTGTLPGGRISINDVKAFAKHLNERIKSPLLAADTILHETLPDFSKWGVIEHVAMTPVRFKTARHLSHAWSTIPHVTHFDKADITELEALRTKHSAKIEAAGAKLSITAILLKIVAASFKSFPQFNCSINLEKEEISYKKYVHIGVAVDTDRGLLVPVIRNVDQKNISQLSLELAEIAVKARNKKLTIEEMQGGTFTISNLGGIGGINFTPIINAPEVAILGVSRAVMEPVYRNDKLVPRLLLPLALSYDHRIIDGADAARYLRWIVQAIEQPFFVMLEG